MDNTPGRWINGAIRVRSMDGISGLKTKKELSYIFLPREGYFKTAFVFGEKATNAVMQSNVVDHIKSELSSAKAYAEGRGIRIDVINDAILDDIRALIDIKIAH